MEKDKKTEFGKTLKVPNIEETQTKIAQEQIKSIAFREMSQFDFDKNGKMNLQELAKKVAKQCNIQNIKKYPI